MLGVLLVDDQTSTIKFLKNAVPWDEMDMYIAGEAMNGLEALEIARSIEPDIIITDIKMPMSDGLELISNVRKNEISCKFIILSAYGEFEYAKKAIEYGVSDYILKPIDKQNLLNILSRIKTEIEKSTSRENEQANMVQRVKSLEKSDYIVHRIKKYVEDNYTSNISLDSLAGSLNISKYYLSHLFRKSTGGSFWDYLTEYRIEKAKNLLLYTNDKTYEIAIKVGYENASYFSTIFKKCVGVTPVEFKNSNI